MPRIYNSANDPLDFCKKHFPIEDQAEQDYGNCGDGPDGRGNCFSWDADHPNYLDSDYCCEVCNKKLTEADN